MTLHGACKIPCPCPKGRRPFSPSFPCSVQNAVRHSEPGSCSLASLADQDGAGIHRINSDHKWVEVTQSGTPNVTAACGVTFWCLAAEGTRLPKFESLWSSSVTRDTQGEGGSPSVWASGAVWRDWQGLCNAKPKEGQLHFFLDLDSAAKHCAFLCSACPGSKFLLGPSSWFIRVPFPSSDGGCRDRSTKMHKAAGCINA